jgi:hypothetical protein
MADPSYNLILQNILTTLSGISIADGYKTDVATVYGSVEDWEAAHETGVFPWLGVMSGLVRSEYQPGQMMRVAMTVSIVAHVMAGTLPEKITLIGNLQDDIIAAMHQDITRGGNAVMTTLTDQQDDSGDSGSMDDRGGSSSAVLTFEIVYFRTIGST